MENTGTGDKHRKWRINPRRDEKIKPDGKR